ncbi:MAG: hypothetical protein LBB76_10705, partial [Azoarcus sp.]|nr:hypothetical protein [Azoarcus sp.]
RGRREFNSKIIFGGGGDAVCMERCSGARIVDGWLWGMPTNQYKFHINEKCCYMQVIVYQITETIKLDWSFQKNELPSGSHVASRFTFVIARARFIDLYIIGGHVWRRH